MKRTVLLAVAALLLGLTGCAEKLKMSVLTYADPGQDLTRLHAFAALPGPVNNDLLQTELVQMVQQDLTSHGMVTDPAKPDFVFSVQYTNQPFYLYYPPSVWYGNYGYYGYYGPYRHWRGGIVVGPGYSPGYAEQRFERQITVFIADPHQVLPQGGIGPGHAKLLWQGTVASSGGDPDFHLDADLMLQQLMGEFPKRTGLPTFRKVEVEDDDR